MEDTLGVLIYDRKGKNKKCLNPCSNGRYSRRLSCLTLRVATVLILVLMEDTLGVFSQSVKPHGRLS